MCGLVGFIGEPNILTKKMFDALLIEDTRRGRHSTGMVAIDLDNKKAKILKRAVDGETFVNLGGTEFLRNFDYNILLGHNRYATTGEVNDRNSHPFGVKINNRWVFGIHNGVIKNYKELSEEFGIMVPQVDSESVFRSITKLIKEGENAPTAIKKVTKRIKGDFAFIYYIDSSLYFWRNSERPLFCFDMQGTPVGGRWFASTKEIFSDAAKRLELGAKAECSYFEVAPMTLYSIDLGLKAKKVIQKMTTDFPVIKPTPIYTYYDKWWEQYHQSEEKKKRQKKSTLKKSGKANSFLGDVNIDERYLGIVSEMTDNDLICEVEEFYLNFEEGLYITLEDVRYLYQCLMALKSEIKNRPKYVSYYTADQIKEMMSAIKEWGEI